MWSVSILASAAYAFRSLESLLTVLRIRVDDLPTGTEAWQPTAGRDGHRAYLEAVEAGFGADVDYAQLIKLYGEVPHPAGRYSPAQIQGAKTYCCTGKPDPAHISTSYVERQNLTMRMSMRRFTRLTNGFSKKAENHGYSVAIHFMHYNFVRIHQSLRITPAMAAGVTQKLWSLTDMVRVIEDWETARPERVSGYTLVG